MSLVLRKFVGPGPGPTNLVLKLGLEFGTKFVGPGPGPTNLRSTKIKGVSLVLNLRDLAQVPQI